MVLPGVRNKVKLPDSEFSALMRSVAVGGLLLKSSHKDVQTVPKKLVALTLTSESLLPVSQAAILPLPLLSPFAFLRNPPVKYMIYVFLFPIHEASEELSHLAAHGLFLAV